MLRHKETETAVYGAKFPGDVDHTHLIAISNKDERKANIARKDRNKCRIAAAIEIQRVWRGYSTRSKLWQVTHLQDDSESEVSSQQSLNPLRYPGVYAKYQKYLKWCQEEGIPNTSPAVLSVREYAAQTIQSWWKKTNLNGKLAKPSRVLGRKDGRGKHGSIGSKRGSIGGGRGSIGSTQESLSMREAATIIQRVWRRHNDIKVFQFYRELINFQGRGNPNLMLRSINPKEAQLLDKAAGAHVRFRLGGIRFPPNIYYKIFTRRPIVDLCASSPRDYTSMEYKMQQARDRNNVNPRIPPDQSSWYQRHENNGWRLVSDRHFLSPCQDTITIDTSSERKKFHHSQERT